jgi:hypothetical protein
MPALTPVKFDAFFEALAEKKHNLGSDQLVVALSNSAPSASANAVLADVTQISYTNVSSRNITTTSSGQTAGTYKLVLADLTLTATGGAIPTFRYVVVYNSTATDDDLLFYFDYGSAVSVAEGGDFVIDFNQDLGALTIAQAA